MPDCSHPSLLADMGQAGVAPSRSLARPGLCASVSSNRSAKDHGCSSRYGGTVEQDSQTHRRYALNKRFPSNRVIRRPVRIKGNVRTVTPSIHQPSEVITAGGRCSGRTSELTPSVQGKLNRFESMTFPMATSARPGCSKLATLQSRGARSHQRLWSSR